jgi:hypothetical protein
MSYTIPRVRVKRALQTKIGFDAPPLHTQIQCNRALALTHSGTSSRLADLHLMYAV